MALLTEHVNLALATLQKRYEMAPDYPAAAAALDTNAQTIAAMIRAVYGQEAAAQFLQLWRFHIERYVRYTDGLRMNDRGMQQEAQQALRQFVVDISTLLTQANPNLSQSEVERDYQIHVDQTVGAVTAYAEADFDRVYDIGHEAHEHIAMVGTKLAAAIAAQFPQQFPGNVMAPAVDLRFMLVNLFTEYTALAGLATQKAYLGAPDTDAVVAQLDQNAALIGNAVRSVYGDAAADQFLRIWRSHLQAAAQYAVALRTDDTAAATAAQGVLMQFVDQMATLLSGANPNLPRPAVQQALATHVQLLAGSLNAFAAGDYAASYSRLNEAYLNAVAVGSTLATGIVAQFPQRFGGQAVLPVRLPNTGDGSCEGDHGCP